MGSDPQVRSDAAYCESTLDLVMDKDARSKVLSQYAASLRTWGSDPHYYLFLPWGNQPKTLSNTVLLGATRVSLPNGIFVQWQRLQQAARV